MQASFLLNLINLEKKFRPNNNNLIYILIEKNKISKKLKKKKNYLFIIIINLITKMVDNKPNNMSKRIESEYNKCVNSNIEGITVEKQADGKVWIIGLTGTKGSPYEGGKFKVNVEFPD